MKRKLTLIETTAIGLGNIIGAGIFVMAGSIIYLAGPAALISFIITGLLAMSIGINSAELASKYPNTEGGVYSFAKLTMGDFMGFLVAVLITASIMIASLALGNVEVIGLVSNFGTVFSYITTAIAVVISRRRGIRGKFSSPLYPWLQILSIILSLLIMLSLGEESLILGVLSIIIGILIHQIHVQINIVEKGKSLKPHGELP